MNEVYAAALPAYLERGWDSLLPLPPGQKSPPPAGYTGRGGRAPSGPDMYSWADQRPAANVGLRLPDGVLGIDVDAYDGKPATKTLDAYTVKYGELPAGPVSGSRDDGVSGIRLFRVPLGLNFVGNLIGGGIDIIQVHHRYMVVWPSTHPSGRRYVWRDGVGGPVRDSPPAMSDLPALPMAWTEALNAGSPPPVGPPITLSEARHQLVNWTGARPALSLVNGTDEPCRAMSLPAIDPLNAHSTLCAGLIRIARLAAEGHPGGLAAIEALAESFVQTVCTRAGSGCRSEPDATAEVQRAIIFASSRVRADPPPATGCDCSGAATTRWVTKVMAS